MSFPSILRPVLGAIARTAWRVPHPFRCAEILGSSYGLRSIVYHDLSERPSPLVDDLGVSVTPQTFESHLGFITRYYSPVSLSDVVAARGAHDLPPRPILVTFDDAYASVLRLGAPLLARYNVPSAFFINAGLLGNATLALDNLLCYVASTVGMAAVIDAAVRFDAGHAPDRHATLQAFIKRFTSRLTPIEQQHFAQYVAERAGVDAARVAASFRPYLEEADVPQLAAFGIEVGNHTLSHAWGRTLAGDVLQREITGNAARLSNLSGTPVRAFAIPYGTPRDLTAGVLSEARRSGSRLFFTVTGVANSSLGRPATIHRVNLTGSTDADTFAELELFPRLRAHRGIRGSAAVPRSPAADVLPGC